MKRQGTCQKCGKVGIVRDHHLNGYLGKHKDETAPYCHSCDRKAHIKARKEGKCVLDSKTTNRLSINSCRRRNRRYYAPIQWHETLDKNVCYHEMIYYFNKTGNILYFQRIEGNNGKKIIYEDI